jgi:type VI secretion system protein ImpA
MADIDVDALLAPLSDAAPSGADLEYDAAFLALEEASRGKAEQQFGDTVIAATEPDWRTMKEQALQLFERTRDVRVAIQLMRAGARLTGFGGFASGLALVHGLLERQWDTLHPQLDASDNDDPTMRLNALDPLVDDESAVVNNSVVVDLRAAPLGANRASITVRQIELAFGKVDPLPGEAVPSEAGALQGIREAGGDIPALLAAMAACHEHVRGIEVIIAAKVGASRAPDLKTLRSVTQCLADAARAARGESASEAGAPGEAAAAGAPARGGVPGSIGTRDDALRALDRVCEWIERHEPTNPAPLLIRRAKRLMTKNFMDIIRDLAPDGLSQVERIAGVDSE